MNALHQKVMHRDNHFYRHYYQWLLWSVLIVIGIILAALVWMVYEVSHRPLPVFYAKAPNNNQLQLTASLSPNLYSSTIITWASKAAVAAYTFDFANYNTQLSAARPYFTEAGWASFRSSVAPAIASVVQKQLIVSSVVNGAPIISNQGPLADYDYVWRVQLPFLVTYQAAEGVSQNNYTVILTIIKVPSNINPAGIGIDQFIMV